MALYLVTPPAAQPVNLADIKQHVRRAYSADDDAMLQAYLDAAVAMLDGKDGILGRCMVTQSWGFDLDQWARTIALPFPDVASATIRYRDAEGVVQTVAASAYELSSGNPATLWFNDDFDFPALSAIHRHPISVEFEAGFGDVDAVPAALKQVIRMMAAHWFVNREAVLSGATVGELPLGVATLISTYRWVSI